MLELLFLLFYLPFLHFLQRFHLLCVIFTAEQILS